MTAMLTKSDIDAVVKSGLKGEAAMSEFANILADKFNAVQEAANDLADAFEAEASKPKPVTQVGLYNANGTIFKVVYNQSKTKLYAKKLLPGGSGKFEYMASAIFSLTADQKMSLAEVKAFGLETGVCACCGITLTDPKSIDAGIGPVCAKKYAA